MANAYTFQVLDQNDLVSASVEASIANCARYVIGLISRYIDWKGTIDFVVEIRPAAELTWSDADGLLPSIVQTRWNGSAWVNDTLAECVTGFDADPNRPDAGCTIYLAEDGTIKNYGSPVWFDPDPAFEKDPAVPGGMHDFVGIFTHEVFHALGFVYYTREWTDRIAVQGDIAYFTGANAAALYGGAVPFQNGFDHYGYSQDPAIPIGRGLMYQFGNYAQNRLDIGRIDLAILADLGHTVKSYDGLSTFEFVDTATDLAGSAAGEALYGDYHSNLLSGLGGGDRIEGGSGDDRLNGGAGDDVLNGGAGDDSFDGGANDTVPNAAGGYGDRVSFADRAATQGAVADLRTGAIANDGFGNVETMVNVESLGPGTAFADTFYGNDSANALLGGLGDSLYGFGGDDLVYLTAAAAMADGGTGNDLLVLLSSGGGLLPDSDGDGLAEIAPAMTAGWFVYLPNGFIEDGAGNVGQVQGFEAVHGSELDDTLYGSDGDNVFEGGGGVDVLHGLGGDDRLSGGEGNDLLRGYAGVDRYDGGADDGLDPVNTGYGDRVSFFDSRATQGVVADLRNGIVSNDGYGNSETMANIESLGADTAFADMLYGNDSANALLGGLGDSLYGFGGDDLLQLSGAAAVVDGGAGTDQLRLTTFLSYRPDSNGDGLAEEAPAMTSGYVVDLARGTLRDGYGNVGLVSGVEILIGTELRDELRGSAGANSLSGGAGNDFLLLQDGGDDGGFGGEGNDVLYFGAALTAGDVADGGAGRDAIVLQGNVTAVLTATNLIGIESISIQSGANATFGDTANNFYDYDVTTADGNVLAGQQLIVNAQSLRAGEDFTFDGSAESDGKFVVYGGHGVDYLTGGAGVDVFFFEGQRWTPGDRVDGGGGRDSLVISAGSGLTQIAFAADSFTNIESISLNNRFATDPSQRPSYELVLHNGNVTAGGTLIVNGSSIPGGQLVNIDGRGVHDGNLILFGGGGHDTLFGGAGSDLLIGGGGADALTGGAGADTFRYDSASDSVAGLSDLIGDFQSGIDRIDLSRVDANSNAAGDQAFTWIGGSAFSGSAGELRTHDSGGYRWIEGDTDGNGSVDFAIAFYQTAAPQVQGDFIL